MAIEEQERLVVRLGAQIDAMRGKQRQAQRGLSELSVEYSLVDDRLRRLDPERMRLWQKV